MSFEITEAFVQQYSANVMMLSQQKGSRLRGTVRNESQTGKSAFYDRIGTVAAQKKVSRHGDTPQLDTPHSRRMVTLEDYEWADLIDKEDKIRMLNDPTSEYVMSAMWALGRSMDDVVIDALGGTAKAGESGGSDVVLPSTQKYAANTGSAFTNLNVLALRNAKLKLDAAEVDPSLPRYLVCTSSQMYSLLGQTEITSADYNSVKALVQGEVDTFMGFKFVQTERLQTQADALSASTSTGVVGSGTTVVGFRKCYAYTDQSAILAVGAEMNAKISERPDKSYSTQAYASMSLGGVRMEEEQVVEILCKE